MNSLLKTTALSAAFVTVGVAHADTMDTRELFTPTAMSTDLHASNFIGMRVYAAEPQDGDEWSMTSSEGAQTDWDDVGEINDLVISRAGEVSSVLVDVGGFLGLGERQVAMNMEEIRFVSDAETKNANDFFLVIPASKADIENAPAYERMAPATVEGAVYSDTAESLTSDSIAALTAEELTGARVHDASGEWIGEVSQLNLSDDGKIEAAIVDVGGFLGLGEKPVELSIDKLTISRDADADAYSVAVPMSKSELEELSTWEG